MNAALSGGLAGVVSDALLAEYAEVLLRRRIQAVTGKGPDEVEQFLEALHTKFSYFKAPGPAEAAPDPRDQHLWDLLLAVPDAVLVTGDRLLTENPPQGREVLSPRAFVERYLV